MIKNSVFFARTVTAGVNFRQRIVALDYPPSAWTLTLYLRGPAAIDIAATADGDGHLFAESAENTAAWIPGMYATSMRATSGADTFELISSQLQILPDLAALTGAHDPRTENQIALDAIKAVIANRATIDQDRYKINNRELWRTPISDLLKLKTHYQALVIQEKRRGGCGNFGRKIPVRFS